MGSKWDFNSVVGLGLASVLDWACDCMVLVLTGISTGFCIGLKLGSKCGLIESRPGMTRGVQNRFSLGLCLG